MRHRMLLIYNPRAGKGQFLEKLGPVVDMFVKGGYTVEEPGKIIAGGTMTGICAPNDTVSMTKTTNGIVVLDQKEATSLDESSCIRCGRCVEVCPMHLNPYQLKNLCDANMLKEAKANHIMDCILCSSCSYICPARRWIMSSIKNARELIAQRGI